MTLNEKQSYGSISKCFENLRNTMLWSASWIMGWKSIAAEK